eukprot:762703-Hanusia_phi.AAC.1
MMKKAESTNSRRATSSSFPFLLPLPSRLAPRLLFLPLSVKSGDTVIPLRSLLQGGWYQEGVYFT